MVVAHSRRKLGLALGGAALALMPALGFAADQIVPSYDGTHTHKVCTTYNSGSSATCEVSASAETGQAQVLFDITSASDGLMPARGYGDGHASVHAFYDLEEPAGRLHVVATFHVETAKAVHTGLFTNTIGLVDRSRAGRAYAYLYLWGSSDCGVRTNFCSGGAAQQIVSHHQGPRELQDVDVVVSTDVRTEDGSPVSPGRFVLEAGVNGTALLDGTNSDNGRVTVAVTTRVLALEVSKID